MRSASHLVHGEGDGLPGLIIDIYGSTAVIQTHSSGMFEQRAVIAKALMNIYEGKLLAVYDRGDEKVGGKGTGTAGEYLQGEKQNHSCSLSAPSLGVEIQQAK